MNCHLQLTNVASNQIKSMWFLSDVLYSVSLKQICCMLIYGPLHIVHSNQPSRETFWPIEWRFDFFQSHTTVTPDDIKLEAESPTGRRIKMNGDGDYHAQFSAEEIGRLTFFYNLHINDRILNQNAASYCTQCLLQVTTQT